MTEFRTRTEITEAVVAGLVMPYDTDEQQAANVIKKLEEIGLYFDDDDLALL